MLVNSKIIFFTILGAAGGGTGLCCLFNDTNSLEKTVENLDEKTNIDSLQDQHTKLLIEYEDLSNEFKEKIFENDVIYSFLEKHEVDAKEEISARKLKIEKKVNFLELLNIFVNHLKEKLRDSDQNIDQLKKIEENLKKEIHKNLKTKNNLNENMKKLEKESLEIQEKLKNLKVINLVVKSNFENLSLQKNDLIEDIESLKQQNQVDLLLLEKIKSNIDTLKQNKTLIDQTIAAENLKISNLSQEVVNKKKELNVLTLNSLNISSSYEKNKKDYEEKTAKFNSLKRSNEKIQNEIESLNYQIFIKTETQNKLKSKIQKLQSDNNSKTEILKQKKEEQTTLKNQKNSLDVLNNQTTNKIQKLTEDLKTASSEVENLENQILEKIKQTNPLINKFDNLINQNQELKLKKQDLESQKIICVWKENALKEEISNLKINLGYKNSTKEKDIFAELIESKKSSETKIKKLSSEITNLNTNLSNLENGVKNLNSQNVLFDLSQINSNGKSSKISKFEKIKIIDWHRKLYDKKAILRKKRIKYAHKLSNLFNFLAQSKDKAFFSFPGNLITKSVTFEKALITDESKKIKLMKFSFDGNNIFICNNNHLLDKFTEETTVELEEKLNWNYPVSIIKDIKDAQNQTKDIDNKTFKYHEFQIIASNDQSTAFGKNLVKNWMKVEVGVLLSETALTEKFNNFFSELKLASEEVRQGLDDIASHLTQDLNISNEKINNALNDSFAIAKDYYSKLEW